MTTREQTPPNHPTHGIHLSDYEIGNISRICLPAPSASYAIARLPHGRSFNNRIYFLYDTIDNGKSYVLKVTGKFWGAVKIENEVACLQIVKRFCPTVPVPEVVAWSTNGRQITFADNQKQESISPTAVVSTECRQGWILMTRLPGEVMDPTSLTEDEVSRLSLQLAQMIGSWRSDVPRSELCGNFRFRYKHDSTSSPFRQRDGIKIDLGLKIKGLVEIGLHETDGPLNSRLSYWKARLTDAIKHLSEERVYILNRDSLLPLIEQFNNETLADLPFFQANEEDKLGFVFSHTDLSPRNVLISGSPPQISGILDFEFSGFFPLLQDFTGKSIVSAEEDEEGWPTGMHKQTLQHLEDYGIETPLRLRGSSEWDDLMNLMKLQTYIAPWWLSADDTDPEELKRELSDARRNVQAALTALTKDV